MIDQIIHEIIKVFMIAAVSTSPLPTETLAPHAVPTSPVIVVSVGVHRQSGWASYYGGSRGFHGKAHVAVQNGHWTGKVNRYVIVTIGKQHHILPVVDYCQCYRGETREVLVDLSTEAVKLFGLDPLTGKWKVTMEDIP